MKKLTPLLLAVVLVLGLLAGCTTDNSKPTTTSTPTATASASAKPTESASAGETVKTGLAVINSVAKSTDAGTEDGVAEVDSTIVAVTVGADGKIVSCVIDQAQTKITFSSAGKITTPLTTEQKTKNELGDSYGMKAKSSIGKEWYEEAKALADYVTGKTVDEVKGIAVDESGYATGSDLTASVTISISGFLQAIEKAVTNASDHGAKATDTLKLGVITEIKDSKDAGTEDGLAQAYSTYVAVTADGSGKVTSCIIDASQSGVNFNATGKITSDLSVAPQTKDEIGDAYGMKAKSGIGKEWYEEAAAFAAYVVGKTASEIQGIAVDEAGHATSTDLTSSVTISIGNFQKALAKALK